MVSQSNLPVQRACRAVGLGRATYYRPLVDWARRDAPVIAALTTLVAAKSRWGCWKCSEESLAAVAGLRSASLELATTDEEAAPGSVPPAAHRRAAAQCRLGGRLHE